MLGIARPCLRCGELSAASRCDQCEAIRLAAREQRRGSFRQRGYGRGWGRLSRRARALQPWCTDCRTTDDLTADHTPEAWAKVLRGERLTLSDVEVLCAACNSRRGSSRPGSTRAREAA